MKKILRLSGLLFLFAILAGCQGVGGTGDEGTGSTTSSTEKFSKTTVFNPNSTKVKLVSEKASRAAENGDVVCEVEPLEKKEIELGNEHSYYFTDAEGNKIADLSKSDNGDYLPVYLELNEPKKGTKYLLLNQYKNADVLESYPRNPGTTSYYETYGLLLYEIVEKDSHDAYKYNENTYIRTYPSANLWIDSEGYASNKIGTEITYNSEIEDNFEYKSNPWVAWGWSTYDKELDMWFCHRVVSSILHAKDGDTYTVKKLSGNNTTEVSKEAVHISVKNVENGIEVTISKKDTDPNWQYGVVSIKENGQTSGCSYSYFQNGNCILDNAENKTFTFLYPFTTKDSTYTFTINPYNLYTETVSIVAENTSNVQLQNLDSLKNLKVIYEEKDDESGAKRIIKVTQSPFEIFTKPEVVKYKQLCVNLYSVDQNDNDTWVYNFGHNSTQENLLFSSDGLDFIGNNSSISGLKSADDFKNELNKNDKIVICPHFQFNIEPYSKTSGNFIISFGSYSFSWTKIN